jgi:hypothetical protein
MQYTTIVALTKEIVLAYFNSQSHTILAIYLSLCTSQTLKLIIRHMIFVLPPSLNICRCWCSCHKFDSICRKYVQHLYLQINLLKNYIQIYFQ